MTISVSAASASPQVFYTQKTDILFNQYRDLTELALRLGGAGPAGEAPLRVMSARIDGMLGEINGILQCKSIKPSRLQISLLPDGFAVQQLKTRLRLHHKGGLPERRSLESFYDPRRRTIFLSLADAHLGVLAHEMVHFILCESSKTPPGEAFQEPVAKYIERRFNAKPPGSLF